jgi:hypothetical protein
MGKPLTLLQRIQQSARASAVERAWNVAKELEGKRAQIEGLQWVEPVRTEERGVTGVTRAIDYSTDFPEGVTPLTPTPMEISVLAPANRIVPGEDIPVAWTMPLLTRMSPTPSSLDAGVQSVIGAPIIGGPSPKSTIDVVAFIPFPRAGAPAEEQFKPEFYVSLYMTGDLGLPTNMYAAVVRYGGKTIRQYVCSDVPRLVRAYADPSNETLFSAKMLVDLNTNELALTDDNAGQLEIFVYRITKAAPPFKFNIGEKYGFPNNPGRDYSSGGSPFKSGTGIDLGPTRSMGPSKGAGGYDGGFKRSSSSPFSLHSGGSLPPRRLSPASAPKEVGDVRLSEGTAGKEVRTNQLTGYEFDSGFGIQPVRIRFQGVREGSLDASLAAVRSMAEQYQG